jgi:hypothetical protein
MTARLLFAATALAVASSAQTKLQLKVHTGAGVTGYDVNSAMIAGDKGMLVIDPQFSRITGGVQGDGPGNSFVYIPSLKAVVAGDTVFDHVYFGVPRDKPREDWMKTLDQIAALKHVIVVSGHQGPGVKTVLSAIAFMKQYIADWDKNVASSPVATYFPAAPSAAK